jgi:hypothetical protein
VGDGDPRYMRGAWMYEDVRRRLSFTIILFVATFTRNDVIMCMVVKTADSFFVNIRL